MMRTTIEVKPKNIFSDKASFLVRAVGEVTDLRPELTEDVGVVSVFVASSEQFTSVKKKNNN